MAQPFAGKVCLVTGGAKGIGLACARVFGKKGAKVRLGPRPRARLRGACACRKSLSLCAAQVVVADVNADAAAEAAEALSKEGIAAVSCPGDVGDKASAQAMVSSAVKAFGGLDVLVANAGIVRACDFLEMSECVPFAGVGLPLAGRVL